MNNLLTGVLSGCVAALLIKILDLMYGYKIKFKIGTCISVIEEEVYNINISASYNEYALMVLSAKNIKREIAKINNHIRWFTYYKYQTLWFCSYLQKLDKYMDSIIYMNIGQNTLKEEYQSRCEKIKRRYIDNKTLIQTAGMLKKINQFNKNWTVEE